MRLLSDIDPLKSLYIFELFYRSELITFRIPRIMVLEIFKEFINILRKLLIVYIYINWITLLNTSIKTDKKKCKFDENREKSINKSNYV